MKVLHCYEEAEDIMRIAEVDEAKRKYERLKQAVLENEGFIDKESVPLAVNAIERDLFIEKYIQKANKSFSSRFLS